MKDVIKRSVGSILLLGITVFAAQARPVPNERLLRRIKSGVDVIGIVHFTVNTFTDREWGYGSEDPQVFNPTEFDAEQIVCACRDGGIRGLVIVAKHHDGFCLWPTATTEHNILQSPFRGGKGDYVKEMEVACRKYGLEFGVYCSPWDRNNPHYATKKYVEIFHRQVEELNDGRYGRIFEMWFDGANGGDGYYGGAWEKRSIGKDPGTYYRMPQLFDRVISLQPDVCIMGFHESFSWPGNESGIVKPDSGASREDGRFVVYEADFPLRPGWFYHKSQDGYSRSGEFLMKVYLRTVGNAATMDIGLSPDQRGLLTDEDVGSIRRFGVIREAFFSHSVSDSRDGFNVVVMSEDVARGERVDEWRLTLGGREIARGGKLGMKRIRVLNQVEKGELVLEIVRGEAKPEEVKVELYVTDEDLVRKVMSSEEPKQPPAPFERRGVLTSCKPRELVYMVKQPLKTSSLKILPDPLALAGTPVRFTMASSQDGEVWKAVPNVFTLGNVAANPVPQTIGLQDDKPVKYLRLTVLQTLEDGVPASLGGVEFLE